MLPLSPFLPSPPATDAPEPISLSPAGSVFLSEVKDLRLRLKRVYDGVKSLVEAQVKSDTPVGMPPRKTGDAFLCLGLGTCVF